MHKQILISCAAFLPILAQADNVVHPGTPVFDRPTLISLGIQLPVTGDDNYNAKVTVQYRKQGDSTWKQGLPLFRVHPDTTLPYVIAPQFAGSILDLRPATSYEIQLHLTDPDGPVDQIFSLTGTTRPVPGNPTNPRIVNVSDPNSLSAALNSAQPGDVITLANGIYYGSFFDLGASGTPNNPIVIRGASQDGVIIDGGNCTGCNEFEIYGSYTHIENLTVQNAERAIKFSAPGTQANVVRGVHIRNTTVGITGRENELDFYIADNILEGRLVWPQIYTDDNGLYGADDGINVSGSGHVVAHNRISGYGKAIIDEENGDRSIDFYGNDILWTYDSGMKFAFVEGNGRMMRNRLTNVYMGMSFQPMAGGPAYVYRNVAANVVSEQLKLHSHANPTTEPNGVFAYNNTFVSDAYALNMQTPTAVHHFGLENNLFIGPQNPVANTSAEFYATIDDGVFDYNGYWPDGNFQYGAVSAGSFSRLQQTGTGIESHGVLVNSQTLASGLIGPSNYTVFYPPQDLSLSSNSMAIDRAVVIPNISDSYVGSGPDLGALEAGCPQPIYGPRPQGTDESNETYGCTATAPPPLAVAQNISAVSGTSQSVAVQTAFAPLQAKVLDQSSNPMGGVIVTFTAPAFGASGTFPTGTSAAAMTDNTGVATAPPFTANTTAGTYTVSAAVTGVAAQATFSLTNIQSAPVPASITAIAGTPQSVSVQTAFAPMQARVLDTSSKPVAGVVVTFTAPGSGATGTFTSGSTATVTTDNTGVATAPPFSANSTAGSYTVSAAAAGVQTPAIFSLTNTPIVTASIAPVVTSAPPTTDSANANGSTFTFKYSSGTGYTNLAQVHALLNSTLTGANGCWVRYDSQNGFYLSDDSGVYLMGPLALGSSGTLNNSQCTLNGAGSSINGSGNTLTMVLNLTFSAAFSGTQQMFLYASDAMGLTSGWQNLGSFNVSPPAPTAQNITAIAGSSQSAMVQTPFAPLQAKVMDTSSKPMSGVVVTFTAPATGPSGTFAGGGATATATTDSTGVATAPAFTANSIGGSYRVTAAVSGVQAPASFSLTNTQPVQAVAASIAASAGTPQSATVQTAFAPLQAKVLDGSSNPMGGVMVTFTAPTAGASGTFAGGTATTTAMTDNTGLATAPAFTANGTAGNYTVSATVAGVQSPATFSLSNTPAPIVSGPPTADSATINGSTFTLKYSSGTGYTNLSQVHVLMNGSLSGANGCWVRYDTPSNSFYLSDDSGYYQIGPLSVGTGATLHNSQCTLNGSGSSISGSGNTLTMVLNLTFSTTFSGTQQMFLYATDGTGLNSGWQNRGSFNAASVLPPAPQSIAAIAGTPQSVTVQTAFAPLQAKVLDGSSKPVAGVVVTFTAPSTGAGGTFAGAGATATATTDNNGVATAPAFTANSTAGSYTVSAAVTGVGTSATFSLTNTQPVQAPVAASVAAIAGTPQSVTVQTAFAPLQAKVLDGSSRPMASVVVTFTAPSTGAGGTFAGAGTTATATTDSTGVATAPAFTANSTAGSYTVSATATGVQTPATFSLTNTPTPNAPTATVSAPPTADSATVNGSTFTFKYSIGSGYANLAQVHALINGSLTGANGCWVRYDTPSNSFYLSDDSGYYVTGPLPVGTAGTLHNSQCTLNGAGSSVSGSGNTLTMMLNLTFSTTFSGTRQMFLYAADGAGVNSGWQNAGAVAIP